jgi:hypothetical protein
MARIIARVLMTVSPLEFYDDDASAGVQARLRVAGITSDALIAMLA